MSGDATHGYDVVVEFSEQAIHDVVAAFFDSDGWLLGHILQPLGIGGAGVFSVDVSFDRPSDPEVPATATDIIELDIEVGDDPTHPDAELRIVAGADMDRTDANTDVARINFKDLLHVATAKLHGIPIPGFKALLRDTIKALPIMVFPVDRTTTDPMKLMAGDVHLVDDTSSADKDASAFLLTFGGGSAGDRNQFSQNFISAGGNGGIAVGFQWLCRVISPVIDQGLANDGSFTDCHLTQPFDMGDGVSLTALSVSLDDGFIRVSAAVSKSGFCYTATGTVGAKIMIEVSGGHLLVDAQVDDPKLDIDIPWYCWVAAVVVGGAILGIVGAVLLPVIMYVATHSVEGAVNQAAQKVVDAINAVSQPLDVPAPVVSLIFSDVFIDDVTIACRVQAATSVPIHSEGVVTLADGAFVDLDSGRIGDQDLPGADLAWRGVWFARHLDAVCGARQARTGTMDFDAVSRATLYGYAYDAPNPIPVEELAQLDPFGGLFGGDKYRESRGVYGVRTNEDRWSAVQVIEVEDTYIRLRYRTWERPIPSVQIVGTWECESAVGAEVEPSSVVFEVSPALAAAQSTPVTVGTVAGTTSAPQGPAGPTTPSTADPCAPLVASVRALLPSKTVQAQALDAVPLQDRRIGRWTGVAVTRGHRSARFDAVAQGFGPGRKARWQINGHGVPLATGDMDVEGVSIHHVTSGHGKTLVLETEASRAFEFLLQVTVFDNDGNTATTSRCIRYEPQCQQVVTYIPAFEVYQATYLASFGVVEVGGGAVSVGTASGTSVSTRGDAVDVT
jgi:hypothetical protein